MRGTKKRLSVVSAFLAVTITLSAFSGARAAFEPSRTSYAPVTTEELLTQARTALTNAQAAGRISAQSAAAFKTRLDSANSVADVEKTWAELEAAAQVAKANHPSLDHLTTTFLNELGSLERKGIVTPTMGGNFYRDRIRGIQRVKKELTAKDHFFDFWEYVTLAIDLSSVQDRLIRALIDQHPELETFNDLLLRTDNYVLRNDVAARGLRTYKSFEVEPDNLQQAKNTIFTVLQDRAHSRMQTAEVKQQLEQRLKTVQYEAMRNLPTEKELDSAMYEVQRLLDSGARNGNLGALDDVRVQHELELIKEIKKAYPRQNPGIDPFEKEMRAEEVRFMSLDLRFLQDWLGRVLRQDGETLTGREEVLRALRRIDLAYFSHRIRKEDAYALVDNLNTALKNSKNESELAENCRAIEAKMDMMISDYSMVTAKTAARIAYINGLVEQLRINHDQAAMELQRVKDLVAQQQAMQEGSQKYGASIVAAYELEHLRKQVNQLLKMQQLQPQPRV